MNGLYLLYKILIICLVGLLPQNIYYTYSPQPFIEEVSSERELTTEEILKDYRKKESNKVKNERYSLVIILLAFIILPITKFLKKNIHKRLLIGSYALLILVFISEYLIEIPTKIISNNNEKNLIILSIALYFILLPFARLIKNKYIKFSLCIISGAVCFIYFPNYIISAIVSFVSFMILFGTWGSGGGSGGFSRGG